jgi:hypothetical protein
MTAAGDRLIGLVASRPELELRSAELLVRDGGGHQRLFRFPMADSTDRPGLAR